MTSIPIFSNRQIHIILSCSAILGLYLVGLGIGEYLQIGGSIHTIAFYIISAIMFMWVLLIITLKTIVRLQ